MQYGDPNFQTLYASLEVGYDNLVDIDLQVAEIEEEEYTYLTDTSTSYEEVVKLYFASIKEDENIKKAKKLNCLAESIDVTVVNTESVIDSSRAILSNESEKLTSKDYVQLELNNSMISNDVENIQKKIENAILEDLGDLTAIKSKITQFIHVSNKIITESKLAMALIKSDQDSSLFVKDKDLSFVKDTFQTPLKTTDSASSVHLS